MEKIKISAVAYTNTKAFIYGIENSAVLEQINLSLDIPSDCAAKVIDGTVDMGLMPVAGIPFVNDAHILTDYCIGSVGAVNSVFIFSDVPATEIKTLKLDPQSRTSNNLAQVLLKFYFKRDISVTTDQDAETDAIVLIGDRTFGKKDDYNFAYDMGEEWMNFTGLPFVYAAWVANKAIPESFITDFNAALKMGLANRATVIRSLPVNPLFDVDDYLMNKLDFELTDKKREALNLFLSYISQL
ncbi:MAG: menaquinone biosynthesis protein [Pedobacter sp.]|uniref:menaquinone biosynthetic enzyme MqnA/MqnD family protein n=1 Tax=Pedobacter sp. TaxID=1411316 RepID=UPI0033974B35